MGRFREIANDWIIEINKVRYIFLLSCTSIERDEIPKRLEKENICHKSVADIQGERPTESKERLLRFPPEIAVEKAK